MPRPRSSFHQQSSSALLAVLLLVSRVAADTPCKCTPDQWEGILATDEREFDLEGGRTATSESSMYVSYDFKNGKYAMLDLRSNTKAIADYSKGIKVVIRPSGCRVIETGETMKQMCMPDSAMYIGAFSVGGVTSADLWQFVGHNNATMKSITMHEFCLPLQEEVHMQQGGYVSIQSSIYLDVTLGIKDNSVFDLPNDCMLTKIPRQMKRADVEGSSAALGAALGASPAWNFANELKQYK